MYNLRGGFLVEGFLRSDGSRGSWSDRPPKPTKVTLFAMILYNSGNNLSKTIPNKSYVMFEFSHCSRYKANLSSIVLSQQFCEAFFIPLAVAKPL